MTMGLFLIIIYFQGTLIFKAPIYFFKQKFKNDFGPIIIFSPIDILSIIIKWHLSLRY